jgi:hypothetical protein
MDYNDVRVRSPESEASQLAGGCKGVLTRKPAIFRRSEDYDSTGKLG